MTKPPASKSIFLLMLSMCLALWTAPTQGQALPASPAPVILGIDQDDTTFVGKWVRMIYAEAFKRLGTPVQFQIHTLIRQTTLANEGALDGESARAYAYGERNPNLIRVEEALLELGFSLYTAKPDLRIQNLEDLSSTGLSAEYRRGNGVCENALKKIFPPERLSDITSADQAVKKLLAGRTDLFCDTDTMMMTALHSPEIKGSNTIRKLISIGAPIPTYPYLNRKHSDLAPRLAAVLKKMKSEGLIERYRQQAERDLGWVQ